MSLLPNPLNFTLVPWH